jgi:hypothetical protein
MEGNTVMQPPCLLPTPRASQPPCPSPHQPQVSPSWTLPPWESFAAGDRQLLVRLLVQTARTQILVRPHRHREGR